VALRMYARMVVAMAARDGAAIRRTMREGGVVVEGCSPAFEATACVIMFDTRMDFPEARMSPADPEAHEFRCTCALHHATFIKALPVIREVRRRS
jgi:hypothetical protein